MLIDKLIAKKDQRQSHRLVEKLLADYSRTQVIVHPPQTEDPQNFVKALLEEAKEIATHPHDYHGILYSYAKKLTESLESCSASSEMIRHWKDFSVHFFQEKLYQV